MLTKEEVTVCDQVGKEDELFALRQQIDELDDEIWSLVERRMQVAEQIGAHKATHDMPVLQSERYHAILQRRLQWASGHGISSETVQTIMDALHHESIAHQA